MANQQRWLTVAAAAAVVVACQAPSGQGTTPQGAASLAPGAKAPANPQAGPTRIARRLAEPAAGKTFKASQYWDFEPTTPFEIEDVVGQAKAQPDGSLVTEWKADVKLPSTKLLAKLPKAFRLLQDEEEGPGAETTESTKEEAKPTTTSAPASTTPQAEPAASPAAGAEEEAGEPKEANEAEAGDDGPAYDPSFFAGAPEDSNPEELKEEIPESEDDIAWSAEEDYALDADGDGEVDPEEAKADAEEWTEAMEDKILAAPHQVKMTVKDLPPMSEGLDECRIVDEATGNTLLVQVSQDWGRFELSTGNGTRIQLERTPENQLLVDGKPAADPAALILTHPELSKVDPHLWSMFYARLMRLQVPQGTRSSPVEPINVVLNETRKMFDTVGDFITKTAAPVMLKVFHGVDNTQQLGQKLNKAKKPINNVINNNTIEHPSGAPQDGPREVS